MIRYIFVVGFALAALQIVAGMEIGSSGESIEKFVSVPEQIVSVPEKINQFSFDFAKEFKNLRKNMVMSPMSIYPVLSMLSLGTKSSTRSELLRGLHLEDGQLENSLIEIKKLIQNLELNTDEELEFPYYLDPTTALVSHLANGIFVEKTRAIEPNFVKELKSYFNTTLQAIDFSNLVKASKIINTWVEEQTHSLIKNIVSPDSMHDQTAIVLVNTLYLKGSWANPFQKRSTQLRDFHLIDGTTKSVMTMYADKVFKYGVIPNERVSFIELPFQMTYGRREPSMKMSIIIPDNITDFENASRNIKKIWMNSLKATGETSIKLFLPKFEIQSTIELVSPLKNLNIKSIFDDTADFSSISKSPLKINDFVQKVFVNVHESGMEAAAASVASAVMLSAAETETVVEVDKPFLFIVATEEIILFIGKILDPTESN